MLARNLLELGLVGDGDGPISWTSRPKPAQEDDLALMDVDLRECHTFVSGVRRTVGIMWVGDVAHATAPLVAGGDMTLRHQPPNSSDPAIAFWI